MKLLTLCVLTLLMPVQPFFVLNMTKPEQSLAACSKKAAGPRPPQNRPPSHLMPPNFGVAAAAALPPPPPPPPPEFPPPPARYLPAGCGGYAQARLLHGLPLPSGRDYASSPQGPQVKPPPPPPLDLSVETAAAVWWLNVGRFAPKAAGPPPTMVLPAGFDSSMAGPPPTMVLPAGFGSSMAGPPTMVQPAGFGSSMPGPPTMVLPAGFGTCMLDDHMVRTSPTSTRTSPVAKLLQTAKWARPKPQPKEPSEPPTLEHYQLHLQDVKAKAEMRAALDRKRYFDLAVTIPNTSN